MKAKITQIIILCFIVFMLGGILASVKGNSDDDVTAVISDFENVSEYDPSGYTTADPFGDENVNEFGKLNGKVGKVISEGINKGIDLLFEFVKKIVS